MLHLLMNLPVRSSSLGIRRPWREGAEPCCWCNARNSWQSNYSFGIAQIHDGFPDDRVVGPDGNAKGFLIRFDPQSLLLPDDYYDATFHSHEKLSTNPPTYKFKFDVAQPAGKVGDYVAVSPQPSAV